MKKILLIMAISFLVLTAGGLVLAQESSEKIPSPNEIKNYTQITRIGNSLYGIKIRESINTTTANLKLEKIAHPQEIALFDKIQKIGSALWGIKKNNTDQELGSQIKKNDDFDAFALLDHCGNFCYFSSEYLFRRIRPLLSENG